MLYADLLNDNFYALLFILIDNQHQTSYVYKELCTGEMKPKYFL